LKPTIPQLLEEIAGSHAEYPAQMSKDADGVFHPTTYSQLLPRVDAFAAGLTQLGVAREDRVGLISENRQEWFIADLAILSLGAADVPRGNDTTPDEVSYILSFAGCKVVCAEDRAQTLKVLSVRGKIPELVTVIVLAPGQIDSSLTDTAGDVTLVEFAAVEAAGAAMLKGDSDMVHREREKGAADDVATVIFTSGTTGIPKGVMLTHENFLHQVRHVPDLIKVGPGDIWLCVLPVWHSFERIMQYVALGTASCLAYSKPIGRILIEDLGKVRPTWMASVPRIWEAVMGSVFRNVKTQSSAKQAIFYFFVAVGSTHANLKNMLTGRLPRFRKRSRFLDALVSVLPWLLLLPLRGLGNLLVFGKLHKLLGGRFVAGISGGGALPSAVDSFFQAAGILLLEGYGLTETGPVLGVRAQEHPVPSTVGPVFPGTEIRVIDESGAPLPPGQMGIIMARGPQVMKGYYNAPEETAKVLSPDGWINTGDLGMLTYDNEIKITGRAKDTIVLRGGENVEPLPIEQKLTESPLIDHAILQGQDQKVLGVLLVPNAEALMQQAVETGFAAKGDTFDAALLSRPEVQELYGSIVRESVSIKTGFKGFERIGPFQLIAGPLTIGDELSQKQEVKRHVIKEKYAAEIAKMFE
jgi:long-chain acyl-CoA synthetase